MTTVPPTIEIRPENPDDPDELAAIDAVLASAFPDETVQRRLVAAMRASPDHRPRSSLVALEHGTPVGYVMVSFAWLDGPGGRRSIAALAPLGVAASSRGRGIGGQLLDAAAAAAEADGSPMLVLEGPPGYYTRHGFVPGPGLGVTSPLTATVGPTAPLVRLLAGYHQTMTGRVVYSEVIGDTTPD